MKIKELKKLSSNAWKKRINTSSNKKIALTILVVLVSCLFLFYTPQERQQIRLRFGHWIYSSVFPEDYLYSMFDKDEHGFRKMCGRNITILGLKTTRYNKGYNKDNCKSSYNTPSLMDSIDKTNLIKNSRLGPMRPTLQPTLQPKD